MRSTADEGPRSPTRIAAYLAKLLLEKDYHVVGTSRDAQVFSFDNLQRLGVRDEVECRSMVLTDFCSTLQTFVRVKPDEIYYLAGQSSVGLSFEQPVEIIESISLCMLNLLDAIRFWAIRSASTTRTLANATVKPSRRAQAKQPLSTRAAPTPWLRADPGSF